MGGTPTGRPHEARAVSQQWSATIEITGKVEYLQANERGYFDAAPKQGESKVLTLRVTAPSLEALRQKLVGHINLTEDDLTEHLGSA